MRAYSRKDSPWTSLFVTAGAIGLTIALLEHSFAWTFVVASAQHQALFHVAWSVGLLLGATAACFDEALHTREFLEQRPIRRQRLVAMRIGACVRVLAAWFVLAPLVAYIAFAVGQPGDAFGPVRHLRDLWCTMAVAVSACGIGFAAGSLPLPWWGRLVSALALFASVYSVLFWVTYSPPVLDADGRWRDGPYVDLALCAVLHAAAGAFAFAFGALASLHRRDPDRPWPPVVRGAVLVPLLVLCAPLWCMVQMGVEGAAVAWLHHNVYPEPMVDSSGDNAVLTRRVPDQRLPAIVDENHASTGDSLPQGATFYSVSGTPWVMQGFLRLEAPRGRAAVFNGLVLDTDGSLWRQSRDDRTRSLIPVVDVPRFGPRSSLGRVSVVDGEPHREGLVRPSRGAVWDPDNKALWLIDFETGAVRRDALREGDTFRRFGNMPRTFPPVEGTPPFDDPTAQFVVGERFAYVWRDEALQAVGRCAPEPANQVINSRCSGDVLEWTLVIAGKDGVDFFSHHFTPKTPAERSWAAAAMACSLLRPPVAQLGAWVAAPPDRAWQWLADPLVAGGRRAWLVGACLLVGIAAAWLVRRRLLRLGAPVSTIRFWVVATLLLGVGAAICSVLFERPRAYARRVVPSISAPRIFTPVTDEVPA